MTDPSSTPPPTEGTIHFEGMVEGRMPPSDETRQRLEEYRKAASKNGLPLSLEIDGGHFSLLAEPEPIAVDPPEIDPAPMVCSTLNELAKCFEGGPPPRLFSTLRSREYRKNQEVQTIYSIDETGAGFEYEQRTIDVKTRSAEKPMTPKERLRAILVGGLVALAILGVVSLFVDLSGMWARVAATVSPVKADEIVVDAADFADYFTIEKSEVKTVNGRRALVLTVARTEAYPITPASRERAWSDAPDTLTARLPLMAVHAGRMHFRMFDEKNKLLGTGTLYLGTLDDNEKAALALPIPRKTRPVRVVLSP